MATYKVLQDIEAEDKFVGPLTLRQFIYAAITALCLYLSFWALTKHAPFFLAILLPPAIVGGILAWPWSRDQPTEIWILAKIRFALKPRRRIWNQDGISQLVTITAPKRVEKHYTNELSQTEVKSRLRALADTIDSRGWAIKNVNTNLYAQPSYVSTTADSDRLLDLSALPQEVSNLDVQASDDILDPVSNPVAQHLDQMIKASGQTHRGEAIARMQSVREGTDQGPSKGPTSTPQNLWFMQTPAPAVPAGYATFDAQTVDPNATTPTPEKLSPEEEKKLLAQLHPGSEVSGPSFSHMRVIQPLSKSKVQSGPAGRQGPKSKADKGQTTSRPAADPAILGLANNDDLNVATLAREANKSRKQPPDDEVVVSLR
jgi:hypothetical protein